MREKAGFTHDRGKLNPDVRGKRFSTHGAEERRAFGREERPSLEEKRCLSGEKQKNRPGTAPDLLSSDYRGETLAVQPFAAIGINFILQDTEVQDLFVSDLAFVLPFPLSQERIESPRNVCSKYRPGLENE